MKKMFALLLAVAMVFTMLPITTFAAETDLTISFETTFTDDMTVGDTFTVTANLANNESFGTMTLSLKWNEDVVKFTGFEVNSRGTLVTEVFTYTTPVINQDLAIVTASDAYGYDTNGKIFTATFEIIAGGELGIGLKNADATEFQIRNVEGTEDIATVIDDSAISGLTVAEKAVHTCTYDQANTDAQYLKAEATCQSGAVYYYSCTCGTAGTETFVSGNPVSCVYENDVCKWCGAEKPAVAPGYTFATSADVSAENGSTAVVLVKITGHSDENVTSYNAYDLTLTFDSAKLEYVSCTGAVVNDGGEVKVEGNTIRIVGCGADKAFGTEIAALTFKTKAEGAAEVSVSSAQISDKEEAVDEDVPEASAAHAESDTTADETPAVSVIVVPYTVEKPDFVSGAEIAQPGESYTFSFTDTANYTYTDLTVKVGGNVVVPTEADGTYTIPNVTGVVEITATQTPNSYAVTKPENVKGDEQATYGTDYVFTVTPTEGMEIAKVEVNGNEIVKDAEGNYVIPGTDITGPITITVTEKTPDPTTTTVIFSGINEDEIVGGLTQTAEIGEDFSFSLNKDENYTYTVQIGDTVLDPNADGSYTIPAELVGSEDVSVIITKTMIKNIIVEVSEYIKVDGQVMYLITAKWNDIVLAFNGETMYYSSEYTVNGEAGAYCWLVVSTEEMNTVDQVKAAAVAAIDEAAGTSVTIAYGKDVNGTGKVDVNDAQLVYDMYNASYMGFDQVTMKKFLEADVNKSGNLDTTDVANIVSYIISNNG